MMNTFTKLMGVSTMVKKATQESKVSHEMDYSKQETEEIEQKVYKVKTKKIVHCGWYIYQKYVQLKQIKKVID